MGNHGRRVKKWEMVKGRALLLRDLVANYYYYYYLILFTGTQATVALQQILKLISKGPLTNKRIGTKRLRIITHDINIQYICSNSTQPSHPPILCNEKYQLSQLHLQLCLSVSE